MRNHRHSFQTSIRNGTAWCTMLLFVAFLASGPLHLVTGSHCLITGFSKQAAHGHGHVHQNGASHHHHHHDQGDPEPGHNHHSADEHDIEFTGKTGSLKFFVSCVIISVDLKAAKSALVSYGGGRDVVAAPARPPGSPGLSRAPPRA